MATKLTSRKILARDGFTLTELLIGVAISMITVLACYEVVTRSAQNYQTISASSDNIIETLQAVATLKRKISLSVNLEYVSSMAPTLSPKKGQLIDFNLNAWAPTTGDGAIVSVFSGYIDTLKSDYKSPLPSRFDRFLPMAVFFQRPTVNRYGVLYVTIGASKSTTLLPKDAAFVFTQIVDFKISNINSRNSSLNRVSKFDLQVTRRSFNVNTSNRNFKWCPPAKMRLPQCADTVAYRDNVEFTTVNLRNNVIEKNSSQQKIYKAGFSTQPSYQGSPKRYVDGVYFLDATQPAESLKR